MKKYQTIYADPPWQLTAGRAMNGYKVVGDKQIWLPKNNKSRELSYPTMTVEEIKSLMVKDQCAENCHLYLWTTNKHLPYAFDVIYSWGFKYSTTLVWAKNKMGGGLGGAYRINTEFLLFAKRGSLKTTASIPSTWHNVKRQYVDGFPCHSLKPDYFRTMIEKVSPGPYLEMFARKETAGWDVFGNEVENSITL